MAKIKLDKLSYTAESLYQWDKNQTLEIYGMSLPSTPEIHFTTGSMDKAIVRQSNMNNSGVVTVDVPNSFLQKPYNIIVYVCVYSGNTFETWYKFEVPMKARPKPNDYTVENTDGEIYSFNALENKLDTTIKQTLERYDRINEKYEEINVLYDEAVETLNKTTEDAKKTYDEAVEVFDTSVENLDKAKAEVISKTVLLPVSGWVSLSQTVSIREITNNNVVVISPSVDSYTVYVTSGVRCREQGNQTLTFVCDETPSVDLVVNILIINKAVAP